MDPTLGQQTYPAVVRSVNRMIIGKRPAD